MILNQVKIIGRFQKFTRSNRVGGSFLLLPPQRGREEGGGEGLRDFGWCGTLGAAGTGGGVGEAPMNDPGDTKSPSGSSPGRESCPAGSDCPQPTWGHPVCSPLPGIATPGTVSRSLLPRLLWGTGSEGLRGA